MAFPKSSYFICYKVVSFHTLDNLVVHKPFIQLWQNRQHRNWSKVIIALAGCIHLSKYCMLCQPFSIFLESEKVFNIHEFILLVKGLAIYWATGVKNFAGIRSGPVNVSDWRSESSCKTQSLNVTGLREKQSDPAGTWNSSDCRISIKLNN